MEGASDIDDVLAAGAKAFGQVRVKRRLTLLDLL
jgi:hypothetical protein